MNMTFEEWTGLMMQVCADYQCAARRYKKIFKYDLSTDKYISQILTDFCKDLVRKHMTPDDFWFFCQLYGAFLYCYGDPPSEEEILQFNLRAAGKPPMSAALLCIIRARKLYPPD